MPHKIFARTFPLLLAATSIFCLHLAAQEPSAPSVADAARRAREQKQNTAKPAKVITDDTLHPQAANSPDASPTSQPNPSAAPDANAMNTASAPASQAEPASPQEAEEKKKALESLKSEIAAKQSEVDLSQREIALENDNYYSKPDFSNDKDGKAKLDRLQNDLNAKKDDLAKLKAKFSELGGVEEVKPPAPPAPLVPPRP